MGQSTDAIVAFGFPLNEEDKVPWAGYEDFETWWAEVNGVKEPTEPYIKENIPLYTSYWEKKYALERACPVELIQHCSGDYPMYFVSIRGTNQRVYRGSPEVLRTRIMGQDEVNILTDFCAKHSIPQTLPAWYLFSDWN